MTAYYNEIDPFAAQWLRNLIDAGHIAPGVVDTRSIEEVTANDLKGFTQCHFFAGIGVWSYALRCAGWPDNRAVWTGSCPCQPFSACGKRSGKNDERHLFPAWFRLISECRPNVIFGEQVASKDGLDWLDDVQIDMEGAEYTFAALDLCAAGFGAPHIRQRLFWVADADSEIGDRARPSGPSGRIELADSGNLGWLGNTSGDGRERRLSGRESSQREAINGSVGCDGPTCGLAHAKHEQRPKPMPARSNENVSGERYQNIETIAGPGGNGGASATNGFWRDADWLFCRDGKWRPVKPGIKPLAHGVAGRVGQLRASGNAIVAPVAEAFISAYLESAQ